jgi:hypothetical protein
MVRLLCRRRECDFVSIIDAAPFGDCRKRDGLTRIRSKVLKRRGNLVKLLAVALLVTAAFAPNAHAAEQESKLLLDGSWAVDVARLPTPPGARPKSVTITFKHEGADRLRTKVEVVDPSGNRLNADGLTPLDGTPTPVKSNFEADVSATTMPRPNVLIMQLGKNGNPGSTRIYAVNADGNSMIETVAYFGADGQPVLRKNYFSRIR